MKDDGVDEAIQHERLRKRLADEIKPDLYRATVRRLSKAQGAARAFGALFLRD
jgi:hypothetical protein